MDILIKNIKGLAQVRDQPTTVRAGPDMAQMPVISNAYLMIKDGLIADYGRMEDLPVISAHNTLDASGAFVFPGFVDSHTHLVFAASREDEFVMKIKGATYADFAAHGGGILNSARKVQLASEDALFDSAMRRAEEIIRTGTGVVEIKSGYGLTTKYELKTLRVARRIGRDTPLTVKTTFLGAHAVPSGVSKASYIASIIEEMIPAVAAEKLADYIDVFCEHGFFSPGETEAIVEAGKSYGMKPRIHAN